MASSFCSRQQLPPLPRVSTIPHHGTTAGVSSHISSKPSRAVQQQQQSTTNNMLSLRQHTPLSVATSHTILPAAAAAVTGTAVSSTLAVLLSAENLLISETLPVKVRYLSSGLIHVHTAATVGIKEIIHTMDKLFALVKIIIDNYKF